MTPGLKCYFITFQKHFAQPLWAAFFPTFPSPVVPLGGIAAVLFVSTALLKVTVRTGVGKIQVSMKLCLQRPVSMKVSPFELPHTSSRVIPRKVWNP